MRRVELGFEWDEKKAQANLAKHRVSFLTAAEIFSSEILERIDDVYRVVFTWRSENLIRIISAQKASRNEREIYFSTTHP